MNERIIIYGTSNIGFSSAQELIDYLSTNLIKVKKGRFRYTQCKNADIIILSMNGFAYGHLMVKDKVDPTIDDISAFKPVKCTYRISDSVVYDNPVKLYSELGIRVTSFGTSITRNQFLEIQKKSKLH